MTARRKKLHRPKPPRRRAPVLFERFMLSDLLRWAAWGEEGRRFHWNWHSDLAYQRSRISDKIRNALAGAAEPFAFQNWRRVGRFKYALHPLSIQGSLKLAGRFNVANLDAKLFPPSPALYLASDRQTALQEVLGQDASVESALSAFELALTNPNGIYDVPLRGSLKSAIHLGKPEKLEPFVELVKGFSIAPAVIRMARENSMPEPKLIRTTGQLIDALVFPLWRQWPALFGVPSSSQLFAQLALDAGVEGIVYPSKFNNHENLAVFPQAFTGETYIELADDAPAEVKVRRLDASTAKALT